MGDNKERIVRYIRDNDFKSLRDHFGSITNKGEANYSLLKNSSEISNEGHNNNHNRRDRNTDGPQEDENIPTERLNLLHIAAYYDSLECFRYIERTGKLKLRSQSAAGYYPLHYACYSGSNEVALYILSKDPSQAQAHPEGINDLQLLYCATLGSDPEILQALFDNGAKMSDQWNKEEKLIAKGIGLHNRDILSILMKNSTNKPGSRIDATQGTAAMRAVINHNVEALEVLYRGKEDITPCFTDRSGFHSLVSLICETDVRKIFKGIFKRILTDARDIQIEPEYIAGKTFQAGVCHWACMYLDVEIARLMFKTPGVEVNRLDKEYKTGAAKLIEKKDKEVVPMLEFLYSQGFNFNTRKDEKSQSLLENFLTAISKNYQAIEFIVNHGADVNVYHSRQCDKKGNRMTLIEFVREKGDSKLKKIFGLTK